MRHTLRMTTGLLLCALLVACNQSRPPEASEPAATEEASTTSAPAVAELPEPTSAAPAPDAPVGSMVVYACDDGSGVTVTYDEHAALVKLPSGSTMLTRAEDASGNGIDAYLGEELSLYRDGNLIELQIAGKSRTCNKS